MGDRVVHTLSDRQVDDLMALYAGEFWCAHRTRDRVLNLLRHTSLITGIVDDGGRLVAFCRVLTDFEYRATLYDVIVAPGRRGEGLGAKVVDAMLNHPKMASVESVYLACKPEMAPFYQRWQFSSDFGDTIWMRRRRGGRDSC